ncbi:hypothetical protein M408DRAFT_135619 [Serendipita vermifera MAFF 305830]|uniref:Monopolin complex subunit Csm1/Pcs1 C-terminal domain-containing protein n=1 Tax=Serendipita vermifera MAFF 305830 TaxID=933852 RepID=A0A0C3AKA4_SERVB|nr:hypothetical protein M408DRAFT_135619 [Serendipita vermifera MAFF 305830]
MEAVKPSAREEALQTEIDSLNALLRRQQTLLELRNSEYTKSRLINRNPTEPADWVTVDWAEAQRDKAVAELTTQMNKLTARVEKAEKGRKDAEREGAEAQRQVAIVQRELDVEVANSKKLQAEIGRRPNISQPTPVAGSSSLGKKAGPGALELEKKLELFEDLSSLSIISYVEAVEQPGNVKKVSYTCLLSVEDKEFPFKLVIWDERVAPVKGEETEHVVYSPGEPLDPDLDIGYLAQSFTFPRSQMHVFYQNMLNVLTDMGQDAQEEGEEEEEEE